jgi:formate dehydrogenase accessory protein FdhD
MPLPPESAILRRAAPLRDPGRAQRDPGEPLAAGHERLSVERWTRGEATRTTDEVAEEAPIALSYHGVPHVVMLATPMDLEDLAYGFTLSEELVANAEEIRSVEVAAVEADAAAAAIDPTARPRGGAARSAEAGSAAIEVRVGIAWERFPELLRRRRNLTGRTGCGLCGTETLDAAIRDRSRVGVGPSVPVDDLHAAIVQLESLQPINERTGSVHAAAWVIPGRGIYCVREDVGRHNALDKAIGALVRARVDLDAGYMLVTSRASYEMVQKAATVGIAFLAALSAPTGLAVRHAERSGLTLVAFARRDRHVVYTHAHRLGT